MNVVYVVASDTEGTGSVDGAFSTLEKAIEFVTSLPWSARYKRENDFFWRGRDGDHICIYVEDVDA